MIELIVLLALAFLAVFFLSMSIVYVTDKMCDIYYRYCQNSYNECDTNDDSFVCGDTVVFNPSNLNQTFWESLSEEDRIKYYGDLGYGKEKPVYFTFLGEHKPQTGHCVLVNMDTGKLEIMRHTSDFSLVDDEEC